MASTHVLHVLLARAVRAPHRLAELSRYALAELTQHLGALALTCCAVSLTAARISAMPGVGGIGAGGIVLCLPNLPRSVVRAGLFGRFEPSLRPAAARTPRHAVAIPSGDEPRFPVILPVVRHLPPPIVGVRAGQHA